MRTITLPCAACHCCFTIGSPQIVSEQFLSPKPTPKPKSSTPGIDNDEPIPAAVSSLQPDFFSEDSVSKTPSSEGNKHQLPVLHVDSLLTRSSKTSPSEAEDETPPFIRVRFMHRSPPRLLTSRREIAFLVSSCQSSSRAFAQFTVD